MKKYYDFVFMTKEALTECLNSKVGKNTKKNVLSKNAKQLLGKDLYNDVPVVDECF